MPMHLAAVAFEGNKFNFRATKIDADPHLFMGRIRDWTVHVGEILPQNGRTNAYPVTISFRQFVKGRLGKQGWLEVKTQLHGLRARRHIMRATESGKEIVESSLVGHIDGRKPQAPLVPVAI